MKTALNSSKRIGGNRGTRIKICFILVLALALAMAAGPRQSSAAGMTAHITVGEKAVEDLGGSDLVPLIAAYRDAFRSGTLFPDQVMSYFNSKGGYWKQNVDGLSHAATDGTLGIVNEYLLQIQNNCPNIVDNAECQEATVFLLGMLNHLVADAAWHKKFIYSSLKQNCQPGVTNNERWHSFADIDVDICLAKRLNDFPAYSYYQSQPNIAGDWYVDESSIPTAAELPGKCPAADELTAMGCYACPDGYTNTPAGTLNCEGTSDTTTASIQAYPYPGSCPAGQFVGGGCYQCPADYYFEESALTDGIVDPTESACTKVLMDVVNCDLIPEAGLPAVPRTFDAIVNLPSYLRPYFGEVHINVATFQANSTVGYDYSYYSYLNIGAGPVLPSTSTLRTYADSNLLLVRLEHMATLVPTGFFSSDANNCDWGYEHVFSATGGIDDSASKVAAEWAALRTALDSGARVNGAKPLAIWRTDAFNYGVYVDGSPINCVYGPGCTGSELRYGTVEAGSSVTTYFGPQVAGDLVDTTVTSPSAGYISIFEQSYASNGSDLAVKTVAPSAATADPLVFDFHFRINQIDQPITVRKGGVSVAPCDQASGEAVPDPCIASTTGDENGATIRALSASAGQWTFLANGSGLVDSDWDMVLNAYDNCSSIANPLQENNDHDALGDPCDPDDDNDGLTDDWEQTYGFDPLVANEPDADTDGDGIIDLEEMALGTSPLDPNMPPADVEWSPGNAMEFASGPDVYLAFLPTTDPENMPITYTVMLFKGLGASGIPLETIGVDPLTGYTTLLELDADTIYTPVIWASDGYASSLPTKTSFAVTAGTLPGDIDFNGMVDGNDLVLFKIAMLNSGPGDLINPFADIDGNGVIDQDDLAVIVSNFGRHRIP